MGICPGKYICMDQSSNKGIYKDYVKEGIQCSFKTMNIEMKNMMNLDEDHHEHNNILMFIGDQNVCPEFQVKACGTHDTCHNTIGHPTTAI
ncbi:hypothetical protein MTR_1g057010 [Medicago truncatula]|uniref:Uncharacterized protein n=1 Tax=Medicago truncatula TaxID=3880 RepID=A0A072VUZ5_MEDTR|nr:hypothetical protein MTR_1g057010 [Medicago truncatula]